MHLQKIIQKFNKLNLSKIEKIRNYTRDPPINLLKLIIRKYKKNAIRLAKQHKRVVAFVNSLVKINMVGIEIHL